MNEAKLPRHVRDILARYDEGYSLKDHELMTVQMVRNGFGCSSCYHTSRPQRNPASAN